MWAIAKNDYVDVLFSHGECAKMMSRNVVPASQGGMVMLSVRPGSLGLHKSPLTWIMGGANRDRPQQTTTHGGKPRLQNPHRTLFSQENNMHWCETHETWGCHRPH
jgi:hypothetical protein